MKQLIKSVFKGNSVEVYKHIQKTEDKKVEYVIDTYLNDMYLCMPNGDMNLGRPYSAEELKSIVENDSVNQYIFTKEAYDRCEKYFSAIAL